MTLPPSRKIITPKFFFPDKISISSLSACGRSTLLKLLREALGEGYSYVSAGDTMRMIAQQLGFPDIEAFARFNRKHPEAGHDYAVDEMMNCRGAYRCAVFEGRLTHLVLLGDYKVRLKCPIEVCARRRAAQLGKRYSRVLDRLRRRDQDDVFRYEELYHKGCMWTDDMFDLVIDTSECCPLVTRNLVLDGHRRWVAEKAALGQLVYDNYYEPFEFDVRTLRQAA